MNAMPTTELPAPLLPVECDLRHFKTMPLDVERISRSKLARIAQSDPRIGWTNLMLWTAAWHETPAGSLPDDPEEIANLAQMHPDAWAEVAPRVMRSYIEPGPGGGPELKGWVLCSDGRWYHTFLCKVALAAWRTSLEHFHGREMARIKKANQRKGTNDPMPDFQLWLEQKYGQVITSKILSKEAAEIGEDKRRGAPTPGAKGSRNVLPGTVVGKVIGEADGKCSYCSVLFVAEAAHQYEATVDHIVPIAAGGTDDPENLIGCCRRCNSLKRDMAVDAFLSLVRPGDAIRSRVLSVMAKFASKGQRRDSLGVVPGTNASNPRDSAPMSHGHENVPQKRLNRTEGKGTEGNIDPPMSQGPNVQGTTPTGFDAFWTAYDPPVTARKAQAQAAWNQQRETLPPVPVLLACVKLYKQAVLDTHNGDFKPQPVFPNTFLMERLWEPLIPKARAEAEAIAKAEADLAKTFEAWGSEQASAFIAALDRQEPGKGRALFQSWFRSTMPRRAPDGGTQLICVKRFHAEQIERRFMPALTATFERPLEIVVVPETELDQVIRKQGGAPAIPTDAHRPPVIEPNEPEEPARAATAGPVRLPPELAALVGEGPDDEPEEF